MISRKELSMRWKRCLGFGLAALLGGTLAAEAQTAGNGIDSLVLPTQVVPQPLTTLAPGTPSPAGTTPPQTTPAPGPQVQVIEYTVPAQPLATAMPGAPAAAPGAFSPGSTGVPGEVPGTTEQFLTEQANQPQQPKLGPMPVDEVQLFRRFLLDDGATKLKIYGWFDGGYTYRTSGPGETLVAPLPNRFGDEYSFNQIAIRIEKPLDPDNWSWGFNLQPYGGADAALLNPTKGAIISNPNSRFGFDFADLNLTAHLPVLTEGGVDIKAGRQTTVVGSQAAQAPWRIFYSNDYQWFFAEEHFFTGITATWHVSNRLDFLIGYEHGWNTFFQNLSEAPTLIAQINYWLQSEKKTLITLSVENGPEAPDSGANTTLVEVRLTQNWNRYFSQIVQSHLIYSKNGLGGLGLERAYGVYLYNIYHVNRCWDFNSRFEWYDDVDGHGYPGGTGFANNYFAVTGGVDYHPYRWLQVRPEVRGDFADRHAAFGAFDNPKKFKEQLSLACDFLVKF
jgi:hypothetical protein